MKNLLYKEIMLAAHATNYLFLALSAMLLIPNYPYYVIPFYMTLGIFFTCLTGRENHDVYYTALLPVRKRDIVTARMTYAILAELALLLVAVPFAFLRNALNPAPNQAGMDANTAFFGLALVMLGVFNLVFFTRYYRAPDKVGKAFILGSTAVFLYIAVAEACAHALPYVRDVLDTPDPAHLPDKIGCLLIGAAIFTALNLLAHRRAAKSFEALDL